MKGYKINCVKILYILSTSTLYGASKSLLVLLKFLNKDRFTPYVVLSSYGPLVNEIRKINIPVKILPLKRWIIPWRSFFFILPRFFFQIYSIFKLCQLVKEQNIDIIQTFHSGDIEGALAAKIMGIPHIWRISQIWHIDPNLNPIVGYNLAYKIIESLSDKIIPVSLAVAKYFPNYKKVVKFHIVHNVIDASEFDVTENGVFRKEWGINANTPIVGSIGSVREHKGFSDFVRAASIVKRRYKVCRFIIVGSGSRKYIKKLQKIIKDEGLGDNFIFTGFRTDIPKILSAFDILVIASWEEPFARTVVEGMACKKPIIGANSGGTPEAIVHNKTGLLVPPKDYKRLAEAIIYLLDNHKKAMEIGIAGYKHVKTFFNAEKNVEIMSQIYQEVINRRKRSEKI